VRTPPQSRWRKPADLRGSLSPDLRPGALQPACRHSAQKKRPAYGFPHTGRLYIKDRIVVTEPTEAGSAWDRADDHETGHQSLNTASRANPWFGTQWAAAYTATIWSQFS